MNPTELLEEWKRSGLSSDKDQGILGFKIAKALAELIEEREHIRNFYEITYNKQMKALLERYSKWNESCKFRCVSEAQTLAGESPLTTQEHDKILAYCNSLETSILYLFETYEIKIIPNEAQVQTKEKRKK